MSGGSAPPVSASTPVRADLAAWLAVAAGTLGAFMAMLDTSIVSASLPVIQGEIGATPSEGTWLNTSYLLAEVVVIPLVVWLERMLSLRRLLLIAAVGFTGFSVLCGFAVDLTTMIAGRFGQGLAGGALIPTALTIVATRLPPSQQSLGIAMFAATALLGPVLGPLAGGWLTENFSWHFAFFINVPICLGLIVLLFASLPKAPGDWHELRNADWFGVAGMVVGLGSITVLLEKGHRERWFESALIRQLAIASAIGFIMIAIGQLRPGRPVLKLSLLLNPTLAAAIVLMTLMGVLLFGSMFSIPQFLAAVAGYNAIQSGQVLFTCGVAAVVSSLLYPLLISRVDIRIVVAVAFLVAVTATLSASNLTSQSAGSAFFVMTIFLGVGMTLSGIPLQQVAISAVAPEDAGESTCLFVISRNLGGSIGLAGMASFQDQRMEFHHWQMQASLGANDPALQQQLSDMATQMGGGTAGAEAAYRMLDGRVMLEALVMSFNDLFQVLALVTLAVSPLVLFIRPPPPGSPTMAMH